MDMSGEQGVDIVHDADVIPWPFKNNSFDLVLFNQSLEHLDNIGGALEEARRVLKPCGRAVIQVPYFRSVDAFAPTHRHFFTSASLETIPHLKFKILGFWYGWPHLSKNPLCQIFKNFIHGHPDFYDKYLSSFIPVECLTWELEKRN